MATSNDVILARQQARQLAEKVGFTGTDVTLIATAVSEVARNIVEHAGSGVVRMSIVRVDGRDGLRVVATDDGPGIDDVDLALRDGYSTSGAMGLGLPGARRLMDDFAVTTSSDGGTTVSMCRWLTADGPVAAGA